MQELEPPPPLSRIVQVSSPKIVQKRGGLSKLENCPKVFIKPEILLEIVF